MNESTILHQLSPDDLKQELRHAVINFSTYNPDRFYNVMVGPDWFCKIHNITRPTLHSWIERGIVHPEDGAGKAARFRLSYVLKFNADEFKHKKIEEVVQSLNKLFNNPKKSNIMQALMQDKALSGRELYAQLREKYTVDEITNHVQIGRLYDYLELNKYNNELQADDEMKELIMKFLA